MESGVERVELCKEVTLDIEALTKYSGQGQCHGVYCYGDTAARYSEELKKLERT